jgi:6-phosphofructokinase
MKIGILTGGGDVPGLNPCIKAVVDRAVDEGHEVVGIRRGWGGLLNLNPDNPDSYEPNYLKLDKNRVRTIDRTGGTFLHTSRTNPAKVKPKDVPEFLRAGTHRMWRKTRACATIRRMCYATWSSSASTA